MIPCGVCLLVSKNVATGGGTDRAIRSMSSSAISPGPEGIAPTSPIAEAPNETASAASCSLAIQQIFTRMTAQYHLQRVVLNSVSEPPRVSGWVLPPTQY